HQRNDLAIEFLRKGHYSLHVVDRLLALRHVLGGQVALAQRERDRAPARAPVEVVEIELGDALPRLRPAPGASSGTARALVRLHGRPLGLVDLPLAPG